MNEKYTPLPEHINCIENKCIVLATEIRDSSKAKRMFLFLLLIISHLKIHSKEMTSNIERLGHEDVHYNLFSSFKNN